MRPTTTFNGQADSVTLVANRTANQTARLEANKHCQSNQHVGRRFAPPRLAADV